MSVPVIVLPLDGTEAATAALPVAQVFAGLTCATLHIVNVGEQTRPPGELVEQLHLLPADLRGAAIEARGGDPADAIVATASETEARLIVMCSHTSRARPASGLGRTALAVLREARCPVVLVPPGMDARAWRFHELLLPHDGTPTTSAAIGPAAELARRAGAELIVLYVAAPGAAAAESGAISAPEYLDQPQHDWPAWAGEFIERLGCVCPLDELRVRMLLGRGSPGPEILRTAAERGADVVILAWRGEWADAHAVTMKAVMRDAACPVLILRV